MKLTVLLIELTDISIYFTPGLAAEAVCIVSAHLHFPSDEIRKSCNALLWNRLYFL